jgi:type IV secretory pathway VirB2 component (pilin)
MILRFKSPIRHGIALWRLPRRLHQPVAFITLLVLFPVFAFAQSGGTPFDTGFTALQNLFTGTIAKVASLIAIVVGGYEFAHGSPGAKNFDHGYAVTSHSAQGLTSERVLIHADTGVHSDLLNARFGYVSFSRASHEATLFTNDAAKLGQQLGSEVSKTSAREVSHSAIFGQGIGMT